MHEDMRRSMWIEAFVAAAGTALGCHAVLKVLTTSSSRAPASNVTGTAGVGPGALVPGNADVLRDLLTDVNFLGNLFVLFTVSFTAFLWALRPRGGRRRSGRSGLGVRRTRASPGALSRASTAPSTANQELIASDISDGLSEMLRAGNEKSCSDMSVGNTSYTSSAGHPVAIIMPRSSSANSVRHTHPAAPSVPPKQSCLSAPDLIEDESTWDRSVSVCTCGGCRGFAGCVSAEES